MKVLTKECWIHFEYSTLSCLCEVHCAVCYIYSGCATRQVGSLPFQQLRGATDKRHRDVWTVRRSKHPQFAAISVRVLFYLTTLVQLDGLRNVVPERDIE